jgi:hypothetical protein
LSEVFRQGLFLFLFLTAGKQMIADDEARYDNEDGEKTVRDKKGNGHADANPEQDKSNQPFHRQPLRYFTFILCAKMQKLTRRKVLIFRGNWCRIKVTVF